MPHQQTPTLLSPPELNPTICSDVGSYLAKLPSCGIISRDWDAVRGYLEQCADLAPLLPAICEEARKEFGPETELALELYKDPEIDDCVLTLFVRQDPYVEEIMPRIESVNHQFNPALEEVSGYFLLATDFHRPRGTHAV